MKYQKYIYILLYIILYYYIYDIYILKLQQNYINRKLINAELKEQKDKLKLKRKKFKLKNLFYFKNIKMKS